MGKERRVTSLQRLDVVTLAIERSVLPTAPEDADPLEGKSSEDGLVVFPREFLSAVVSLGPITVDDRLSCPFDEALSQERGRIPSPVRPGLLAALFLDRRYAGVWLRSGNDPDHRRRRPIISGRAPRPRPAVAGRRPLRDDGGRLLRSELRAARCAFVASEGTPRSSARARWQER